MRPIKALEQIIAGSGNIRFADMIALAEAFGMELDRVKKGHHIFAHPQANRLICLQSVRHAVRPYQAAQFLRFVQEYELQMMDEQPETSLPPSGTNGLGALALEVRPHSSPSPQGEGKRKDYHINLFASDEGDGYIADIPDLFACSAFGDTPEKALREALTAKEVWLAAAQDAGKPAPEPRYSPPLTPIS